MLQNDNLNVIHSRAAGLDVHKLSITATIRIARPGKEAQMVTEVFMALPSGLAALVAWLLSWKVSAALMEATGIFWEIVHDALDAAGIKPILVHAQHVKQIKGKKTDLADSVWLSRICQFGLCIPSLVPPVTFRKLRKVSRMRRKIVEERARARNRIHKILDAAGIRVGGILSDLFGTNGMRILTGLVDGQSREQILSSLSHHVRPRLAQLHDALDGKLDDCDHFMLKDQLQAFETASERIAAYDRVIDEGLAEYQPLVKLLTTVPGIDHCAASAILIELGPDIGVFPSARHCAAWAGLCPGNNESAGKRRSGRTRKGNSTLRTVLVACAHGAARTRDCQFHGYHKALTLRRGYKRATVATAHKMLRIIHAMLSTGTLYQDPETNYEELMVKRNAPRWIKMLKKYDIDPKVGPLRRRVIA